MAHSKSNAEMSPPEKYIPKKVDIFAGLSGSCKPILNEWAFGASSLCVVGVTGAPIEEAPAFARGAALAFVVTALVGSEQQSTDERLDLSRENYPGHHAHGSPRQYVF